MFTSVSFCPTHAPLNLKRCILFMQSDLECYQSSRPVVNPQYLQVSGRPHKLEKWVGCDGERGTVSLIHITNSINFYSVLYFRIMFWTSPFAIRRTALEISHFVFHLNSSH